MLTLYTWTTPNVRKASIMLEEIGASYAAKPVNIGKGEQFDLDFLEILPNNKIPAIVDAPEDGATRTVFETGAIPVYLAEKSVNSCRRTDLRATRPWNGYSGPPAVWRRCWANGITFARRAEEMTPAAIERFTKECVRLFHVLEQRLSDAPFLAGDYSIADIGAFTWTNAVLPELREDAARQLGGTPSIDRWLTAMNTRPAVVRGFQIPESNPDIRNVVR